MSNADNPPPDGSAQVSCRIEGPLVISTAADWHRRMREIAGSPSPVAIDLSGVTAVDVFGLQLLLSAVRTSASRGQRIELAGAPQAFHDACVCAGIPSSLFLAS